MSTVDPNKSHQSWSVFFIKGGLVKELNGKCLSFQSGHHQSKKPFLPIYNALKVQRNEKDLQKNETIQWNQTIFKICFILLTCIIIFMLLSQFLLL